MAVWRPPLKPGMNREPAPPSGISPLLVRGFLVAEAPGPEQYVPHLTGAPLPI